MDELKKYREQPEEMVDERIADLQTALTKLQQEVMQHQKANKELRKSEAQLSRITENMLDLIGVTNERGIITYISPSIKNVLGYQPEDILGKSAFNFVHPADLTKVLSAFKKGINSSTSDKIEFRYRNSNGKYIWLETSGNPIPQNGQVTYAVFCSRDITERKQSEEKLRQSEERF